MGGLGTAFVFVVGVLMPWLVIKSLFALKRANAPLPSYRRHVTTVLVIQGIMVALALAAAREEEVDLWRPVQFDVVSSEMAAALFAVMLGTMGLRRKLTDPRILARRAATRPETRADLAWWAAVSLAAGVCEEIVYRGVLMALIIPWLGGNWWATALVCTSVFALAHASQGWASAVFIFGFTLALHWIVRESGNLYTAMILHVVYDFAAGLVYVIKGRREDAARAAPTPPGRIDAP